MSLVISANVDLQGYNTLAVPARALFFATLATQDDVHEALAFARQQALPVMILGGGSNLVLRSDFPGLVLHLGLLGKTLVHEDEGFVWLRVAAGESWAKLVDYTLASHYWGLENLALIPGSVGAAPIQNIGAYGVELKDVFSELTAIHMVTGEEVIFSAETCDFGYRDSVFKQAQRDKYLITTVTLRLRKQPQLLCHYPALRDALKAHSPSAITPQLVYQTVCAIRRRKLPDPAKIPNVGSFFKNPVISCAQHEALRQAWPDIVSYHLDDQSVKLAAGWLIDRAGWRGFREGAVGVHQDQALVLTNEGRGRGDEVLSLANRISTSVEELFGVVLELEPRVYP